MFLLGRLRASTPQVMVTLLVFSLASGVLGGILFYFDSTRPAVMSEMMEDIDVHLKVEFTSKFYRDGTMTQREVANEIKLVDGVEEAEIVTRLDTAYNTWFLETHYRYTYFGVEDSFMNTYSNILELSPNAYPLEGNHCYIDYTTFTHLELNVNDSILAEMILIDGWSYHAINRTFVIAGWFKADWDWGSESTNPDDPIVIGMILSREYLTESFSFLGMQGKGTKLKESVWITLSDDVIYQDNPGTARSILEGIRTGIEQRVVPLAIVAEFPALGAILDYAAWSSSITTVAIAFSIPTIVMGVMLVTYNENLAEDERRRDIGNIRVRGATGLQSFSWIISTSLVTGFLGSVAAILTGVGSAVLSGSVMELMVFNLDQLTGFNVLVSPTAALFVFSFSFLMGLFTSLPSAFRILLMTPTEARRSIGGLQLVRDETASTSTVEILAMGISGVLSAILLPTLSQGSIIGISNFLVILTTVLMFGIFSLTTVRFLSRSTSMIKEKVFARLKNRSLMPSLRALAGIAKSHSKSEALGVMFISMVFVSAFFSAIAATTGSNHMKEVLTFNCGADIVVEFDSGVANLTLDRIDQIQQITGVENAAAMMEYRTSVRYQTVGPYATTTHIRRFTIFGVQPEDWGNSAFLLPHFTRETTPQINLQMMELNQSLVLSSFRPISGFDVQDDGSYNTLYGDSLMIQLPDIDGQPSEPLEIIDILSVDEEIDSATYLPGFPELASFLVVNMKLLQQNQVTPRIDRAYIKVSENGNPHEIIDSIESIFGDSVLHIESALIQIDEVLSTRSSQSVFGIYSLNVIFSLLYLSIGMTIVTFEKNRKLSKQYSVLRALGTERKHLGGSILIDVFLGLAISCIIGAVVAVVMSLLVIQTPMIYLGANDGFDWYQLPVSIAIPFIGLSIFIFVSFLVPLLMALLVIRHQLGVNLADDLSSSE